jgi:hypothetical protein
MFKDRASTGGSVADQRPQQTDKERAHGLSGRTDLRSGGSRLVSCRDDVISLRPPAQFPPGDRNEKGRHIYLKTTQESRGYILLRGACVRKSAAQPLKG